MRGVVHGCAIEAGRAGLLQATARVLRKKGSARPYRARLLQRRGIIHGFARGAGRAGLLQATVRVLREKGRPYRARLLHGSRGHCVNEGEEQRRGGVCILGGLVGKDVKDPHGAYWRWSRRCCCCYCRKLQVGIASHPALSATPNSVHAELCLGQPLCLVKSSASEHASVSQGSAPTLNRLYLNPSHLSNLLAV